MRRGPSLLLLGIVVFGFTESACRRKGPSQATPADAAPAATVIAPVYELTPNVEADPVTKKACDALFDASSRRLTACCKAAPSTNRVCPLLLGSAVRAGAAALISQEVDACAAEIEKQLEGCDWIGPHPPALPGACRNLVHGKLTETTRCRSTLECIPGLFCDGAFRGGTGQCKPRRENGVPCKAAIEDDFAELMQQDPEAQSNGPCEGHCEGGFCTAPLSPGTPCSSTSQCDATHHCAKQRCLPSRFAKVDEECTGECEGGARCIQKKCVLPAGEGAPCDGDMECKGACLKKDGSTKGVCGKSCERR